MARKYALDTWRNPDEVEIPPQHGFGGFTIPRWGGWIWKHNGREYRTDRSGDGLWMRGNNGDWHQSTGTCQFSVPRDRAAAIRLLRREGYAPDPL